MKQRQARRDRVTVFVVGLILTLAAVAGALWCYDLTPYLNHDYDVMVDISREHHMSWVGVGALVVGGALLAWGLAGLVRRLRVGRTGDLRLSGSSAAGRLTLAPSAVARAAAEELTETMGVGSAQAKVVKTAGGPVIDIAVTAEPTVSLPHVLSAVDDTMAHVGQAVGNRAHTRVVVDVSAQPVARGPRTRVL